MVTVCSFSLGAMIGVTALGATERSRMYLLKERKSPKLISWLGDFIGTSIQSGSKSGDRGARRRGKIIERFSHC